MSKRRTLFPAGAVFIALAIWLRAMISPGLQPSDVIQRYLVVVSGEIAAIDSVQHTFTVKITHVHKGSLKPGTVKISVTDQFKGILATLTQERSIEAGSKFVAFAGKSFPKSRQNDVLFYMGGEAGAIAPSFHEGTMEAPDQWRWTGEPGAQVDNSGKPVSSLGGTWNGSTEAFVEMLQDYSEGKAYLPRMGYGKFKEDLPLDQFEAPVRGVALYDIDGNGKLDIYACSPAGNRAYLQMGPMKFANATARLKLGGVRSSSCSFADVDGDGRADLLADGVIYLQGADGFAKSDLLPAEAGEDVKSSAFVEINGDGYPDVVISKQKGGLRVYLNPGAKPGAFRDATAAMGLDRKELGAGETGFFAPGDWNGDDRMDLFYAAGPGYLMTQTADGRFTAVPHKIKFNFHSGEDQAPGLTGAGVFAALLGNEKLDLVIPSESGWTVVTNRNGVPLDVSRFANELGSDASFLQLGTIAEDFNVDGYMDLFTTSRDQNRPNFLAYNRGYGSFMHATAHPNYGPIFQGPAAEHGGWGVAAGDVDDDGATDILMSDLAGDIVLLLNDTLNFRKPMAHPTEDIARLMKVKVLTARVSGKIGVLGAKVLLLNEEGRAVARRDIGSNVSVGSCGPNTLNLAVREPGIYKLSIRFSDGRQQAWSVDLREQSRVVLDARRSD